MTDSTIVHLRTNVEGSPISVVLTASEAHDSTAYADQMDEWNRDPGMLLTNRGSDNDAIHYVRMRPRHAA
jgi:hypothetical protein